VLIAEWKQTAVHQARGGQWYLNHQPAGRSLKQWGEEEEETEESGAKISPHEDM
jgi:hypothetical protein